MTKITAMEKVILKGVSGRAYQSRLKKDLGPHNAWLADNEAQEKLVEIRRNTDPVQLKADANDLALGLGRPESLKELFRR